MQIFQIAATNPIKKSKDFDNPINAVKMQRRLCNALKPVLLVYIIYIQIVVINSETSILWKLNVESGNIDSFPEGQRHVRTNLLTYLFELFGSCLADKNAKQIHLK